MNRSLPKKVTRPSFCLNVVEKACLPYPWTNRFFPSYTFQMSHPFSVCMTEGSAIMLKTSMPSKDNTSLSLSPAHFAPAR
uniref:Uncharacterized protein n=1 Tax=Picea sitchensis TaxID=3332 RepID=A0A6B9XUS0_PICSI|nr:hypothetical protein Q903MT_gene4094 [Picea sitchensis]